MDKLDKFYTKSEVSEKCLRTLFNLLSLTGKELFLEPSAGSGSFSKKVSNCEAYDILPEDDSIIKQDFLKLELEDKRYITIGNPPFGKRSKLAIDFFNKCSEVSDVVAFILPITFNKYNIQKKLNSNFSLIYNERLLPNSFLDRTKEYRINCTFQIWVNKKSKYNKFQDLRIKEKPITKLDSHFLLYQYNGTIEAKSIINNEWDIGIYRQGYKDYNKKFLYKNKKDREFIEDSIKNTTIQFFLIKCMNEEVKNNIMNIDFNELANLNLSTPGFGKADFITYYLEKYGQDKRQ